MYNNYIASTVLYGVELHYGSLYADSVLGLQGNLLKGTTEVLLIKFTLHFLEQEERENK